MADPSVLELCRLRDQAMACVVYDNWQILGEKTAKKLQISEKVVIFATYYLKQG